MNYTVKFTVSFVSSLRIVFVGRRGRPAPYVPQYTQPGQGRLLLGWIVWSADTDDTEEKTEVLS